MADSLRRELKPWKDMNVVVVEPGSIATPIWDKGTDNFDAAIEAMGPEAERLYGPQLERMKEVTLQTAARGMKPVKVAEVIGKAISEENPKARYIVGRDAKVMARIQGLVGDKNFDAHAPRHERARPRAAGALDSPWLRARRASRRRADGRRRPPRPCC